MRVVVIGGGALGSACALFLKLMGGAAVDVQVLEPDPTLALASSARSAASIRQQFSNAVNVQMSRFGWQVLSQPEHWLAVDGQVPALGLVTSGYLFLAGTPQGAAQLAANRQVQQAEGAAVQALDAVALARRFPWLNSADLLAANLGLQHEGWFDGEAYARALAAKARHLGAVWQKARMVGGLLDANGTAPHTLRTVTLDDGRTLGADAFVLTTGAWSGAVGRTLGLDVPVEGRKRTVFHLSCPTALKGPAAPHPAGDAAPGSGPLTTPLVIDPSGVWFRSEGSGFIAGWSPGAGEDDPPDRPLDQPDLQQFDDHVWPALAHRVPAFEALRVRSAWDGWYEVHPLDHNALLGPHPACANLMLACGFSGHGLQHAAAAGRGVAEWVLTGGWRAIDLSPLDPARIVSGSALVERAVI